MATKWIMFKKIFSVLCVTLACSGVKAQQMEQRIALVIGNGEYKVSPLKNPINDARDMSQTLRGYGFTVIERFNLTTRQVGQTLREFKSKLSPGSVAVVFYAGHGVQVKGENFLPTVDAEISGEEDVPMQSLSTRQIMDVLTESKTRMNIVFLDACRDNPYAKSFRSSNRGIAKENAPSGTLMSFATRPGSVAGDGDGRNGLYTSILLEQIKHSNQPIEQVLKSVASRVKLASKGQQEPWTEGSIEGDFCFSRCNLSYASSSPNPDDEAWLAAQKVNSILGYQAYLEAFPNGKYASAAKIASLQKNTSSSNRANFESEPKQAEPNQRSAPAPSNELAICNGASDQVNKSVPKVIDKITTLKAAVCFQDTKAVVFQYRMQLSVPGNQVNLNLIKPNMISTWCTDPQLTPMLKLFNIQYNYTDQQGNFIGRIDISTRDCS